MPPQNFPDKEFSNLIRIKITVGLILIGIIILLRLSSPEKSESIQENHSVLAIQTSDVAKSIPSLPAPPTLYLTLTSIAKSVTYDSLPLRSTPVLSPTTVMPPLATTLPVVTVERVESEWPEEMNLSDTGTIRLTLLRISDQAYQPVIEIPGNSAVVATVVPIGTPQALLKDAFGPGYHIFANAKLANPAFTINLVSPQLQPFDEPKLDWIWSISPQKTGEHTLNASISILWALGANSPITKTTVSDDYIQRQIWRGNFKVNVTEPLVRPGSYTLGELWQLAFGVGIVGTLLGAFLTLVSPWLQQKFFNGKQSGTIYLSTTEAAKKMSITPEKVRMMCKDDKFPGAIRESSNGQWRIPIKEVDKWIDSQK